MKKALFLVATAVLTLASCGKSDDNPTTTDNPNTPIPNNPEPPKTTEVKRIKEVKITYLKRDYVPLSTEDSPRYQYTVKNSSVTYMYDEQGCISKETVKEEGKPEEEITFEYPQGKIVAKFGNQTREDVLNSKGYYKGYDNDFVYDAKGQLIESRRGKYTWTEGNISQLLRIRVENGETETITTTMTYYPNENKNKWLLFSDESGDIISKYISFFKGEILLPIGVPTKNLIKSMTKEFSDVEFGYTSSNTTAFSYDYDNNGYVTKIVENRFGVANSSIGTSSYSPETVKDLEKKIAKIQDGTLKNLSYKLISNNNGIYKFVITYKKHITQDTNGKPIDVKYEQERYYEFSYKEKDGKREYLEGKEIVFTKQDASTIYEISYY